MPTYRVTAQHRDVTSGGNQTTYGLSNVSITATGEHEDRRVVTVGTSEEVHTISTDIGDAGICYLQNKDATNFVDVGFSTGVYGIRLKPGIPQQFELVPSVAALFLKADSASCNVLLHIREA